MTTPPHRQAPRRRPPGGLGEQPTQPLRPVSGAQPYDRERPSAQQPPYDEHSGRHADRGPARRERAAVRRRRTNEPTAVVTGIIAVLALLVAGLGAWALTKDKDEIGPDGTARAPGSSAGPPPATKEPADANVGDCIKVNKAGRTDADVETIDCGHAEAVYRVGVRVDGGTSTCPGENYVTYTEGELLLCLTLNARSGDCFHEDDEQDVRVPCDPPDASYRVGEIFEGSEDPSKCGEVDAENAFTYPEPPLTICRVAVR